MPTELLPPIVREPVFPVLLLSCTTALGRAFLTRMPGTWVGATRLERGLACAAIGLGILSAAMLFFGLAGLMNPRIVAVFALVVFASTLPNQLVVVRGLFRAIREPGTRAVFRSCLPWFAPMFPVLAFAALGAMAPPTDPDGLYYQLTAPRRWLQTGRLDYLATLPQTNLPAGVNLLFALAMSTWGDIAAKTTHFAMGLLTLGVLFSLGRRWVDARCGALLASLWLLATASVASLRVPDLFTFAYVDLGVALECSAAVMGWILWRRTASRRWFAAAALCAGFAASFKFTAVLIGGGLAVLSAWVLWREGSAVRRSLGSGALFLTLSLLPVVPWLVRGWLTTGNPVYLMAANVFPTRDWPADAGAVFSEYFRIWVWGMGWASDWGESTRKAVRLCVLAAVGLATLVHAIKSRDEDTRGLGFLAGLLVAGSVAGTGLYLRYVLFALPILWLLALGRTAPWLGSHLFRRLVVVAFLAGNALLALRPLTIHVRDDVAFALGRLSRNEYLGRRLPAKPLWDFVNTNLPSGSPILLAAGRESYYIKAPCLVTEAYYQFAVRMDNWENFRSDLGRFGVRYLIANTRVAKKAYPGPVWPHADNEVAFIRRAITEGATLVTQFGDDAIYELKPGFATGGSNP